MAPGMSRFRWRSALPQRRRSNIITRPNLGYPTNSGRIGGHVDYGIAKNLVGSLLRSCNIRASSSPNSGPPSAVILSLLGGIIETLDVSLHQDAEVAFRVFFLGIWLFV